MSERIKITAPGRIHVNLFDMSNSGYRQNGGIGFCITGLDTIIEFVACKDFKIIDNRTVGYSDRENDALINFLERLYASRAYVQKFCLTFLSGPAPHSGFGTGTSTRLACVEAAYHFNHVDLDIKQVVLASGRGGTSGVGVNTYFSGGMSIDLGVKSTGLQLAPSSARQGPSILPTQILSLPLPISWQVGVIVAPKAYRISAEDEISFFKRTCPVDPLSVHQSIYHAMSGMACSAIESDFDTFCSAINAMQGVEWKEAEWRAQADILTELRKTLHEAGAKCVGLSSLGPAIYFMSDDLDAVFANLNLASDCLLARCFPNNSGRTLEID
ncbi:beta-ribofuranosylaminobenzene 5'-phosphate synthase family protein [Pseudomonas sp. UBA7530]|uniref:beta-ribofuranosylaminobenzene 5'-phosphate synthase family protein n=1 Tax=Pseudomonas sp. UBA7530 TaxID=1947341 RepID=UPI0025D701E4|nr:beta-ribofuranosylaminobenzene 5'-phosphate synthase family protein [Pseudomonas sp. UBA7530]